MLKVCVVLLFLGVTISHASKLPPFFSKCKKSDPNLNECVLETTRKGFIEFKKGNNEFHIQSVSPLQLASLFVDVHGSLIINITNVTISGFEDTKFKDVRIDLDKKEIYLQLKIDTNLIITGQYDTKGQILILPIRGNGHLNVTLAHPDIIYRLSYDLETYGGKEYIVPKKYSFNYNITGAFFDLQNLFNGNKQLGDNMLKFLNENWKEVEGEVGVTFGEALGRVVQQLLANFFRKVPYHQLLDD